MNPIGYLDSQVRDGKIYGWAFDTDSPGTSVQVTIYVDGSVERTIMTGNLARPDVQTAYPHFAGVSNSGFQIDPPVRRDGQMHQITASVAGVVLGGSVSVQGSAPASDPIPVVTTPAPTTIPATNGGGFDLSGIVSNLFGNIDPKVLVIGAIVVGYMLFGGDDDGGSRRRK